MVKLKIDYVTYCDHSDPHVCEVEDVDELVEAKVEENFR